MRLADYLDTAAARFPDREAIVFGSVRLSYAQARGTVHAIANRLLRERDRGLAPGSHVGIYSPNDHRVSLIQLGINKAGLAWVGVHDRNAVDANAAILSAMDCALVFFHSRLEPVVGRLKTLCPGVRDWVCIDRPSGEGPALDAWSADCHGDCPWEPVDPAAIAFIAPTGGTTGPSKGAVQTQASAEAEMCHISMSHYAGQREVRLLTIAPLSHVAGHLALALLPTGGTSVIVDGFRAEEVLETIERERITHFFLPPTLVYVLLDHPRTAKTDFSSLRCLLVGAAPIAPEKFKEAVRVFGPVLLEGYGQSETLVPILQKRPGDYLLADGSFREDVLKSAGRAWDFVRVEIMDDDGNILPPGTRGEIVVRAPYGMSGYYKNPEATAEAAMFGFHHTGDIGVMDAEGFVTIVDRKKDMIVTGGFNVYPAEVEAMVNEHPAVLDCIVVGVPDDKWGEAVKAVVQLRQGASVEPAELMELCRQRLGGVKAPKSVEIWPDLPRSAVGKLLRREVRAKYWAGHWRAV